MMDLNLVRDLKLKPEGANDYRLVIDGKQTDICCRHLDNQTRKFGLPRVRQMLWEFLIARTELASEAEKAACLDLLFAAVQGKANSKLVYGLPDYVKPAEVKVSIVKDNVRSAVRRVLHDASLRASS